MLLGVRRVVLVVFVLGCFIVGALSWAITGEAVTASVLWALGVGGGGLIFRLLLALPNLKLIRTGKEVRWRVTFYSPQRIAGDLRFTVPVAIVNKRPCAGTSLHRIQLEVSYGDGRLLVAEPHCALMKVARGTYLHPGYRSGDTLFFIHHFQGDQPDFAHATAVVVLDADSTKTGRCRLPVNPDAET